jgi:hypothetical protein
MNKRNKAIILNLKIMIRIKTYQKKFSMKYNFNKQIFNKSKN